MNEKDIKALVSTIIAEKIEKGEVVIVAWAATEAMGRLPKIYGEDVSHYVRALHSDLTRYVKKAVGRYDPTGDETDPQLRFEGYEYLQKAYTMAREDGIELVPIEQCSTSELLARAKEYDAQADGLRRHAKEIRRYLKVEAAA